MIFEKILNININNNILINVGISGEKHENKEENKEEGNKEEGKDYNNNNNDYCFLFLHGMGSSKYTWHNQIKLFSLLYLCIVPDLRGHGNSSSCDNLSIDILVNDIIQIISELKDIIQNKKIILICHSVGGLIGTNLSLNEQIKDNISAVIVLDLIEETGIESLSHMKVALLSWPARFHTIEQCIEFSVNQHRPQSHNSAQISIPSLLVHDEEMNFYTWKTPLLKYETNWISWFEGFDQHFLSLTQPHCLILASIDRLDRTMSAAHMQGLFELHIVHGCNGGHFIQEDHPDEILGIIVKFLKNKGILTSDICTKLLTYGLTTIAYGSSSSSSSLGIGITGINMNYNNGLGRHQINSIYGTRPNWP